jgi:site-specific DNA-methyltransferase (adenine-specific)
VNITAPATPEAQQWSGWGTALKPALEPITVARKPLCGTVAENVLKHGTGGINVDGCRVEAPDGVPLFERTGGRAGDVYGAGLRNGPRNGETSTQGRWPANLIHDGSDEVVGCFPETSTGSMNVFSTSMGYHGGAKGSHKVWNGDSGSAARFFYCAKASRSERNRGLEGFDVKPIEGRDPGQDAMAVPHKTRSVPAANGHPTVKPIALMRYLCRMVTPPGGTVLDPFTGSGTTGIAAKLEGFNFIGIEREAEYVAIARARIGMPDHPMPAAPMPAAPMPPEATPQLTLF